jgi:tRNA nucleotidyltransferase/poly(A) polymerase
VGGGTLSKSNPRKTELNFRNGLSLLLKHLPASALWWKIPARLVLDWMAAFLFLLRGSPADAWAISKAHLTFHLRIRKDFAKRREIEKITPNYNVSTIYKRLLPLQFYLYKRNETSKLREFNNPR